MFARFKSGFGGVLTGFASGLTSGFAIVVLVGGEPPFLSCSWIAGLVVACVPVAGFPGVVGVASLRLAAGAVPLALLGGGVPDGDVDVPSLELFGVTPPGPTVPGVPPLLASVPLAV